LSFFVDTGERRKKRLGSGRSVAEKKKRRGWKRCASRDFLFHSPWAIQRKREKERVSVKKKKGGEKRLSIISSPLFPGPRREKGGRERGGHRGLTSSGERKKGRMYAVFSLPLAHDPGDQNPGEKKKKRKGKKGDAAPLEKEEWRLASITLLSKGKGRGKKGRGDRGLRARKRKKEKGGGAVRRSHLAVRRGEKRGRDRSTGGLP